VGDVTICRVPQLWPIACPMPPITCDQVTGNCILNLRRICRTDIPCIGGNPLTAEIMAEIMGGSVEEIVAGVTHPQIITSVAQTASIVNLQVAGDNEAQVTRTNAAASID